MKEEVPLIAIGFGVALAVQRRFGLAAFVTIASAAMFKAQGYDEIASGKGLSLLRLR